MATSKDIKIKTKPNALPSLGTEILTHRKFVKLQSTEHQYEMRAKHENTKHPPAKCSASGTLKDEKPEGKGERERDRETERERERERET